MKGSYWNIVIINIHEHDILVDLNPTFYLPASEVPSLYDLSCWWDVKP